MMAAAINPVRGSKHYRAKFNEDEVKMILDLIKERELLKKRAAELSNKRLAEKFDVHHRTIEKIAHCRSWTHV